MAAVPVLHLSELLLQCNNVATHIQQRHCVKCLTINSSQIQHVNGYLVAASPHSCVNRMLTECNTLGCTGRGDCVQYTEMPLAIKTTA